MDYQFFIISGTAGWSFHGIPGLAGGEGMLQYLRIHAEPYPAKSAREKGRAGRKLTN